MSRKVYTFTLSMPHYTVEGDLWSEMIGDFEVVEVLSETAFLCVRVGRLRMLWLRFKGWVKRATRAAASLPSAGSSGDGEDA
jgi:hypothetical protein